MTGEWETVALDSLIEPNRGISYGIVQPGAPVADGVPIVRVSDVRDGRVAVSTPLRVAPAIEAAYARTRLSGGELLLTLVGTVGEAAVVPAALAGWNTARAVAVIPVRKDVGAYWVQLALRAPGVRAIIDSRLNTTVQATLNLGDVAQLPIVLPPIREREAIVHILGTLDDKIELNRRINETLEAMARALFKSWFVDFDPVRAKMEGCDPGLPQLLADSFPDSFEDSELGEIPKGWEIKVLDDLSGLVLGGDWGVDEPTPDHSVRTRCVRGADIPNLQAGGVGKMPVRYLKPSSLEKRRLLDGDLVVEISGGSPTQSTGRPVLVSERLLQRLDAPLVCSNFCRLLKPKKRVYSKFVYLWLRALYSADEFLQFENGTTGIKNLAFTLFSSRYKLCTPPDGLLAEFEAQVAAAFSRQQSTAAEADTLVALRDTLLPKLISGELRLKDADRFVSEGVA